MSYGYAIFNINITNQENYKEYIDKVKPLAKKFGAEVPFLRNDNSDDHSTVSQATRSALIQMEN